MTDPQGTYVGDTRVYVAIEGGRLWAMIRATDEDTFNTQALAVGLKVYTNPAQGEVLDDEGNVVTPAVSASGPLIPAPGVTITEMGPYALVPAVLDADGNEMTPPVMDSRYHVNAWLSPAVVERNNWYQWALAWTTNGQPGAPNRTEESVVYEGIELIDPLTVSSPSNTLL